MAEQKQVTIATLLARFEKQGLTREQAMNVPLTIGVHDEYTNFSRATVYEDYARLFKDHETGAPTGARIDCYLHGKSLREVKQRKS